LPRANLAAVNAWRDQFRAERASRAESAERGVERWARVVLTLMVLYVFIGANPYKHVLDPDQVGTAALSPINRYVWMLLGVLSLPLLWARRAQLPAAARKLWPLLALFGWFFMTTRWALDPAASNRRLLLYVLAGAISLGLALGFSSRARLHSALAVACAIMVAIDLLSWLIAPGASMTPLGLAAIHSHKNLLGAVMLFSGIVVGTYILVQTNRLHRAFWVCVYLAILVLLWASQSKTSLGILAGITLSTPVLLFILKLSNETIRAIVAVMIMTPVAALMAWFVWCTAEGLDPWAPVEGITFTQRTDVWAFVFGEIVKKPFTGSGFGSFWDIDPRLQPSLNAGVWFGQPAAGDIANEAHNGYLDLLVTTGVFGLFGSLYLLFRWIVRGLALLRRTVQSGDPQDRWNVASATCLALLPMMIFAHNWLESSFFTAGAVFGQLIILVGMDIDLRYSKPSAQFRPAPSIKAQVLAQARHQANRSQHGLAAARRRAQS